MALTDIELQDIISDRSPEERKQLLSQLGRQVEIDEKSHSHYRIYIQNEIQKNMMRQSGLSKFHLTKVDFCTIINLYYCSSKDVTNEVS